jgi:adenylosuccinate synthase
MAALQHGDAVRERSVVVIGAQWGDEGKGKIVDLVAEKADVVVRYAGGPNAGHTLVVGDRKVVLRLIPSGILQRHTLCLMGEGMVVDPSVLQGEVLALEEKGVEARGRLFVSPRAHVVMPHHLVIDGLREAGAGAAAIGTTKRGIGPAYEDKAGRRGVRVVDLADDTRFAERTRAQLEAWAPVASALGATLPTVAEVVEKTATARRLVTSLMLDTSLRLDEELRRGKRVLLEGAQGTLLDLDHGTYPFVTSSSAIAGGACTGAGIGPSRIGRVLGITKAYATRVGSGPFPTELEDATGETIRTRGGEFGSVTGRPRRTGWLDLPALRYAARVNGVDGWAVTKLDVLSTLSRVHVCTEYRTRDGNVTRDLPADGLGDLAPVYRELEGWSTSLEDARSLADLPAAARALLDLVEGETGVPIDLVSVGPRRDATIVIRSPF